MLFHLEGLTFDAGMVGGTPFTISDMTGWDVGGAEMRRQRVPRPGAHGVFAEPGYLTERTVAWKGLVLTDTEEEQEQALLRLSGLLAAGGDGKMSGAGRWADVQREEIPPPDVIVPGKIASYQVKLSAPDPRMYGEVHEFVGGLPAVHYGNFPATPRLLIGAGSGGYTVTGPNGRRVVVGAAPSAAHEIDFTNGGLYLGGVRQTGAITTYQPWIVGPGLPGVVATIAGSRSLTQRVTDTFI